jgi:hypothetical protein
VENLRLKTIKDHKKLYGDTIVNTTHFIKKSVMVPLQTDEEGIQVEPQNQEHPFMRGIMSFDDYNYKQYNQYVLIEEPYESARKRQIQQERKEF